MTTLDALQAALAAEHAAVFVYGALGARTSESATPVLFAQIVSGYDAHRVARDQLDARISALGATPGAAAASYELPPGGAPPAVARAARAVEDSCQASYASVVAAATGADRRWAIAGLTSSAERSVALGGAPAPFPGAPDLAALDLASPE